MYLDYFKLAEHPFKLTSDPRFLWYSDQHLEAKSKIEYYLTEKAGPIYLLADYGTGKSTLARRLAEELQQNPSLQVVLTSVPPKMKTINAFLRSIMDEFKVKTDRSYARSLKNFENFLIEQYQKNVSPVLLIDEAQNMSREMLLLIQHFFNFSTNTEFLLHMAMFTQPELQPMIERLGSLKSRLSVARLKPFDLEKTKHMLTFRWTVAGGKALPFDEEALEEIFRLTNGLPRAIVRLANETLLKIAQIDKPVATKEDVLAGAAEAAIGKL
jgi:general secretion pathway protein A